LVFIFSKTDQMNVSDSYFGLSQNVSFFHRLLYNKTRIFSLAYIFPRVYSDVFGMHISSGQISKDDRNKVFSILRE